jgi:hypothetical protein
MLSPPHIFLFISLYIHPIVSQAVSALTKAAAAEKGSSTGQGKYGSYIYLGSRASERRPNHAAERQD